MIGSAKRTACAPVRSGKFAPRPHLATASAKTIRSAVIVSFNLSLHPAPAIGGVRPSGSVAQANSSVQRRLRRATASALHALRAPSSQTLAVRPVRAALVGNMPPLRAQCAVPSASRGRIGQMATQCKRHRALTVPWAKCSQDGEITHV